MKQLTKKEMKTVKGAFGPVYYCRRTSDCPVVCEWGGAGPELGYYCGGRVCQLQVCG
jgi:hypothetical protein